MCPPTKHDSITDNLGWHWPDPPSEDGRSSLGPDIVTHHGYVEFKGYLAAATDGVHRLYSDYTFVKWWEIWADDIKHDIAASDSESDKRRTLLVRSRARVIQCQVSGASEIENGSFGDDPGGGPNRTTYPH
jgi:hypothetical protein